MKPLTEQEIKALCRTTEYDNGRAYFQQGKVADTWQNENSLNASVAGSGSKPYQVSVIAEGSELIPRCTCPAHRRQRFCKHVAAVLVAWVREPDRFVVGTAPTPPELPKRQAAAPKPKVERREVQAEGLDKIRDLLVELASYGLLSLTEAQVERVNDLALAAEAHKLRRLARLVSQIAAALRVALTDREHLQETRYAELLSDAWLTLQATQRVMDDPQADLAALEELVGKVWREKELEKRTGIRLLELAYETIELPTGFTVDTSFLLSLDDGALYTEKQITPRQLKRQTHKASYAGRLEGAIGIYPGPEPRRVKLVEMAPEAPATAADWQQALSYADRTIEAALQRFRKVTANPLAPVEAYTWLAPARILVDGADLYLLDDAGQSLPVTEGWRFQGYLIRRPVSAILGRLTMAADALSLAPLEIVVGTPGGEFARCMGLGG